VGPDPRGIRRTTEPRNPSRLKRDEESYRFYGEGQEVTETAYAEALARVDLDLQPQRSHGRYLGLEPVDERDASFGTRPLRTAEPGFELTAHGVQERADGAGRRLHQIDVV
jgi:hypothetical protein